MDLTRLAPIFPRCQLQLLSLGGYHQTTADRSMATLYRQSPCSRPASLDLIGLHWASVTKEPSSPLLVVMG